VALFPDADFTLILPPGPIVPGRRLDARLELRVTAPIVRAQRLDLLFRTTAVVYARGGELSNVKQDLFAVPFEVPLDPSVPVAPGVYSYPFSFDVPAWLPAATDGIAYTITHRIEVRLSVGWATHPKKEFEVVVAPAPIEIPAERLTIRSPIDWHPEIVLDVALPRSMAVAGEPVMGELVLVGGRESAFDAIEISLQSRSTIGPRRLCSYGRMSKTPISSRALRNGTPIRFLLDYPVEAPPTFHTGFIDHELVLGVEALGLPFKVRYESPLNVLPPGSLVREERRGASAYR